MVGTTFPRMQRSLEADLNVCLFGESEAWLDLSEEALRVQGSPVAASLPPGPSARRFQPCRVRPPLWRRLPWYAPPSTQAVVAARLRRGGEEPRPPSVGREAQPE